MTITVPLVMYKDDQRFVVGSIEIEGTQIRGEIHKTELAHRLRSEVWQSYPAEFTMVMEPSVEYDDGSFTIPVFFDNTIPEDEILVISSEDDIRNNNIRIRFTKEKDANEDQN